MTESDEDIGDKLLMLQQRSDHPSYEHVGYINWVHDEIDSRNRVDIDVIYPDGESEFTDTFSWPKDFSTESRLRRAVENDKLPFNVGRFSNDELQGEAVPIDPNVGKIIIPKSRSETLKDRIMGIDDVEKVFEHLEEHGWLSLIMVGAVRVMHVLLLLLLVTLLAVAIVGLI